MMIRRSHGVLLALTVTFTSVGCPRGGSQATDRPAGAPTSGSSAAAGAPRGASVEDDAPREKGRSAASPDEASPTDRPPARSGRPSLAIAPVRTEAPGPAGAEGASGRASENPFGYLEPVAGCFEGRVYWLPEDTRRLPRAYRNLERGPPLYACEWNVGPYGLDRDLVDMKRASWFAVKYAGPFRAEQAGTYRFRVRSDDGSRLFVDGELVVRNDGLHAARSAEGTVELEEGAHTLELEYFQGLHDMVLQVWVTPPEASEGLMSVRPH